MTEPRPTTLILEDIPDAASLLIEVLDEALPASGYEWCQSVSAAREWLATSSPSLALIDLELPDGSGIEILTLLRDKHPSCVRVVTTAFDDDNHLFPALRAGAQGYLLKTQSQKRIAHALAGIRDGQPPLSPSIARRLLSNFGGGSDAQGLTNREKECLVLIAKGYRVRQAADELGISSNTVAGYVKEIYRKLQINSRAEATMEAARLGYISPN